ncbi:MAG: hypothetical protein NTV70_14945 [Acidobacteria bacterium]|nr:hypothetical protein [Acidobacteriota bacterium]
MKKLFFLNRALLACGLIPALAYAATATSPFGVGSVVTAGVVCPPAISQTKDARHLPGGPAIYDPVDATAACPNGTFSRAWANSLSIALSGDSVNGSISGAPAAVAELLPLVRPTRPHSQVSLTIATSTSDYLDPPAWGAYVTFDVHWYGTDPGTALHLLVWDGERDEYRLDITHVGPIDLHEQHILWVGDYIGIDVSGSVIATSTPEPGTAFLAGAALVIVGCYKHRRGRRR